jgi:cytochrome c-type biogenesis protein CcmE
MSIKLNRFLRFGSVTIIMLSSLAYLAYTGVQDSKSYYATIDELNKMGRSAYSRHLRVAGTVVPGSIRRSGMHVDFLLREGNLVLPVLYAGTEAPPDTFKDNSQALADGTLSHDGTFHAKQLQAKCASKYAPQQIQPQITQDTQQYKPSSTEPDGNSSKHLLGDSRYQGLRLPGVSEKIRAPHVANR